jgi:hypothetical protein
MTDYWRAGGSKPPTAWEAFEPYTRANNDVPIGTGMR